MCMQTSDAYTHSTDCLCMSPRAIFASTYLTQAHWGLKRGRSGIRNLGGGGRPYFLLRGTENLSCFAGSQTAPAHPSGRGTFERGWSVRKRIFLSSEDKLSGGIAVPGRTAGTAALGRHFDVNVGRASDSVIDWDTMPEGRGFDFRWDHWIFRLT
jgi:hypothetical protein